MRRIKSAPGNIANMVNRKVVNIYNINEKEKENNNESKKNNILFFWKSNMKSFNNNNNNNNNNDDDDDDNDDKENNNLKTRMYNKILPFKYKKEKVINKKKIEQTLSGILQDTSNLTNKYIPETDNYYFFLVVEFINSFIMNKFNKQNLENLLLSLFLRYIISNIYYDTIIYIKQNLHISY
jgi:hypothetical protein